MNKTIVFLVLILSLILSACEPTTPAPVGEAAYQTPPQQEALQPTSTPTDQPTKMPTATIIPPTATTSPPTITPNPPTATTSPPTITPIPPTGTSLPPTPSPFPSKSSNQTELPVVIAVGFNQRFNDYQKDYVSYAFLVQNTSPDFAFDKVIARLTGFDESGDVIGKPADIDLDMIFPGQTLGQTGNLPIDEGIKVNKIEVELITQYAKPIIDRPYPFSVDKLRYYSNKIKEGPYKDKQLLRVKALITNETEHMYDHVNIYAIAFNESGEIVGSAKKQVYPVPASVSFGFEGGFIISDEVAKVEISASLPYKFLTEVIDQQEDLVLLKQGFWQNEDGKTGIAAVIQNTSNRDRIASVYYTLYSKYGNVVGTGFMYGALKPGQILGLADSRSLNDRLRATRADFMLTFIPAPHNTIYFPTEFITYKNENGSIIVTGEITNPLSQEFTGIEIYAIAFNNAGNIIGAGKDEIDLGANTTAECKVEVFSSAEPAFVELYAIRDTYRP